MVLEALRQQGMGFLTATVGLQPLHQGDQRRVEVRIALQGGTQQSFDFCAAAIGLIEHGQVQVGLGTLGQALLHRFVLGNGSIPVVLGAAQAIACHAQQVPGDGDAHGPHRVVQQRRQ
ncbi:hypothetical protein D3C87_1295710 [compost metagenome]